MSVASRQRCHECCAISSTDSQRRSVGQRQALVAGAQRLHRAYRGESRDRRPVHAHETRARQFGHQRSQRLAHQHCPVAQVDARAVVLGFDPDDVIVRDYEGAASVADDDCGN